MADTPKTVTLDRRVPLPLAIVGALAGMLLFFAAIGILIVLTREKTPAPGTTVTPEEKRAIVEADRASLRLEPAMDALLKRPEYLSAIPTTAPATRPAGGTP